jgi:hypothetical protein
LNAIMFPETIINLQLYSRQRCDQRELRVLREHPLVSSNH